METCSFLSLYDTLLLQILIALYAKAYFFDVVLMYRFIMKLGERKTFTLDPEAAFGVKNPDLIRKISMQTLRENSSPEEDYVAGDMIEFNAPNGATYSGTLIAIDGDSATFDFNHPLSGKTILLEAEIIGIL